MADFIYDLETYPNVFTMAVEQADAPFRWSFEISDWRNDSGTIIEFVRWLQSRQHRMVGFNSLGFDYPILHQLIRMGRSDARTLYNKAQAIITNQDDNRWLHQVKPADRIVPQIDLFKIHHFDNKARSTSLKALEFNMRADSIEDLPFPVGTNLTQDQVEMLKRYNAHDVSQTKQFYAHSRDMISFREDLCVKYPENDWLNYSDTSVGERYFVMKLEQAGVSCYEYGPQGRRPKQTPRPSIALRDAILPWIEFKNPEFQRVLNWLKAQTITETKGVFKDLIATINGFTFVFGLGGIHGSLENQTVRADDEYALIDIDVEAYYPSTAIAQKFRPAHFPELFSVIYADLKEQRKSFAKGTPENAMLKLAINGAFGKSNSSFSPFFDPLMTMRVTLNGQLLQCMLAEQLMSIPGLQMVQCNTDGLTVLVPRGQIPAFHGAVNWWEELTQLSMEESRYSAMFIRDVNNYVAVYENGKRKLKGAYMYDRGWHQDAGGLVVPKVAEKVLVEGAPIRETVENWPDRMDFMLRVKVPRSSYLQWGEAQAQNISRYYISKEGKPLTKWMPPLKGKTDWRQMAVESGWTVQVCNRIEDATVPIDYDWYVQEVEKLVLGFE